MSVAVISIVPSRRHTASAVGRWLVPILALCVVSGPRAAQAQIPDTFRNLQVLPADIPRDSLVQLMRSFSFATGLGCQDCHVMGEGGAFQGAQFHLDDKPEKRRARFMLEMVRTLNRDILPGLRDLPGGEGPALAVECKTCHRALRRPFLLRTELRRVVEDEGIAAAVERYRVLREREMDRGAYDFREWEMNELARELEADGNDEAAAATLELNEEFHPTSASIPRLLGPIYERLGRPGDAIAAYARAFGRNPGDTRSRERMEALMAEGPS